LTPREHECLRLVAQHLSSKEIARTLGLSQHTVDGHLHEARRKLGAPTRRDAVRILLEMEADAPPLFLGGQLDGTENPPIPPKEMGPPPASGGQFAGVGEAAAPLSREPSTDDTEDGHDFNPRRPALQASGAATVPQLRLGSGPFGHELTPPMRLAAIVVIAAVSALVLTALLLGAHELTFLIQRMTEGG
jgi:DNA-binding CsgD family transcriptional regulator